jgi:hypothetical protein
MGTGSSDEVKERVQITLLPFWNFMECSRVNFAFKGSRECVMI